ncbi:MAG: DNA polymerase I [SAR202 cluster bacterium]|nr:DNA polymerase I [SAR202 cluster bacterium]
MNLTLPLGRDKPLLMLMDGHAMVHRAFHAISVRQALTTRSGENTSAVFGFSNTFLRAINDLKPTHCIMAFDTHGPTFRHSMFIEYKAHRPAAPSEMVPQFERVKQLMAAFNIPVVEMPGLEADDIIGTLTKKADEQGIETIILTGDTDTLQLVSPYTRVLLSYSIQEQKVYDETAVRERYGGLAPSQQIDFKAIKGDTSDNIPGVPGLGDKTASKLLLQFGNLEGVYEHIGEVTPPRIRELLIQHKEQAFKSRVLATIRRDAPVELDLESSKFWNYDRQDVVNLMRELEFTSVIPRVPEGLKTSVRDGAQDKKDVSLDYKVVDTPEALEALSAALHEAGSFAFDTETDSLDPMRAKLVGLSFSTSPGRSWYVPVGHQEGKQLPLEAVSSRLKPALEDVKLSKSGHNLNFDVTVLAEHGILVKGITCDTMIAAHLLGRKALGLKQMALDVLHHEMTPITALIGTGRKQKTMDQVSIADVAPYACADADYAGQLQTIVEKELKEQGCWDLFQKVEAPLVEILVTMQRNGITLEPGILEQMSIEMEAQIKALETAIYQDVGHEFNIGSPQQLSDVLFNELKLGKGKRTKTGYSTDASALEALKGTHPVIERILEYRQVTKLKSTYVDSLPTLINPKTHRLHTSYNQAGSATGRISSNDPNLQNIPVRTELGRKVRKAFTATRDGGANWLLFSADYSQIELRVLAHMSQDPALVEAFLRGEDIHSATASMMFEVPIEQVKSDHRRVAKILNFGVIYGLSAFGISQQTEFSPDEGRRFIETYFAKYPGIKGYLDGVREQARKTGYVETLLGRRRYIPEVEASNAIVRQAGERMAINMPIQGTAADIMKLAMIRVHRRMQEARLQSRMLLQVHDELMFEAPEAEVALLTSIVTEEMPNALEGFATMAVPLKVEVKTGLTWGNM